MAHVYHLVPRHLRGEVLYPLNQLQTIFLDVYEAHVQKYRGRETLLDRRVPFLDCLWNDVLHFSPVHPGQIRDGLCAAGFDWNPRPWFEVDPATCDFDAGNTVFYFPRPRERGDFTQRDDDFAPYDPQRLPSMTALPEETAAYYAEAIARDEPPFVFHLVPHVLHRGNIHRDDVTVIEV